MIGKYPDSKVHWGQHRTHLGPVGPRWAPCWPDKPCYQGILRPEQNVSIYLIWNIQHEKSFCTKPTSQPTDRLELWLQQQYGNLYLYPTKIWLQIIFNNILLISHLVMAWRHAVYPIKYTDRFVLWFVVICDQNYMFLYCVLWIQLFMKTIFSRHFWDGSCHFLWNKWFSLFPHCLIKTGPIYSYFCSFLSVRFNNPEYILNTWDAKDLFKWAYCELMFAF